MWKLDCEEGRAPKNWCFWTVVLEKTLEIPLDFKEIQPVHSEDQPWDFFGRNDAKAETPVLWPPHVKGWLIGKDSDVGRDWGQEEKGTTEDEMAGWHHWLDGRESEWTPGVGDGQGGLACCDSWGHKESDTTEWLNWTELNWTITKHFLIGLWRATKSECYMTTSNDQLSGWTEKKLQSTFQSQTCTRKRISLFVDLLLVWSTTAFWILANPLHLRSMLSKLMRYTENYNGQPASVNRTGPILLWDNAWLHVIKLMLQKLNELSHKVLPHISFSPDLLSKDYYFFKHLNNFLQRKCFYNSWRKKMLSKSSLNPKAWFLCYRNK